MQSRDAIRAFAIVALAASAIFAGGGTALGGPDGVVAQATSAPRIGLPRARDYEPTAELRDIHFNYGQAAIRAADMRVLDANAAWLRANPAYLVLIEGHCDNRGDADRKHELNLDLGERRAEAAKRQLVVRGIDPSRITILSYGEERPECTEQNERCWSQNRRARFLVKPR